MKKIIGASYFLILSFIFLVNSAQASHLRGECYLLFEDIEDNYYLVKSTDLDSCNLYYMTSLEDFFYTSVKKFTEGSLGYKKLNMYVINHLIPVKVLPNIQTFKKSFAEEVKKKYTGS